MFKISSQVSGNGTNFQWNAPKFWVRGGGGYPPEGPRGPRHSFSRFFPQPTVITESCICFQFMFLQKNWSYISKFWNSSATSHVAEGETTRSASHFIYLILSTEPESTSRYGALTNHREKWSLLHQNRSTGWRDRLEAKSSHTNNADFVLWYGEFAAVLHIQTFNL